ncbi:hypothetical protein LOC67_19215 [Stieleria sp. JC731]|uniref:hypothetical protein n=1 Tax=Pirellulaceae TaxID=2691357 RepID=UPI001E4B2406|nr:hypothetical protein [Stieleria sp. JC731]MCC9602686.1 hypothetical protein [Stieleria sp. JC731]
MAKTKWTSVTKGKQAIDTSDAAESMTNEFLAKFAVEYKSSELHRLPQLSELCNCLQIVLRSDLGRYCSEGQDKDLVSVSAKTKA